MSQLNLKPAHAAVKNYYAALHQLGQLHIDHEMAVRSAFQDLLSSCGRKLKLTLETHPESPPPTMGSSFGGPSCGIEKVSKK